MQRVLSSVVSSIVAVALGACGTSSSNDDLGYGDGFGTPDNPVPADDSRPYAVTSKVDFTVEAILPAQIELAVVTLRSFSENPARTLILLADQYGVPAVQELYDVIPGVIKDRLEGWINDEIDKIKIDGKTLPQYAGEVAALAETALTQF